MAGQDPNSNRKPFVVGQDRTIDPLTVAFYCTGCPFKAVKTNNRNPLAKDGANAALWTSEAAGQQAPMMHIQYECTSPNFNDPQRWLQDTSTVGFGWCPFLPEKLRLLQGGHDDGDDV
jgi:hypothetical protein